MSVVAAQPPRRRRRRYWLLGTTLLVLAAAVVKAVAFRSYLVVEQSMWPTLEGDSDRVLVQRLADRPRRWQVWVFEADEPGEQRLVVKRVVGLTGEYVDIRDGDLYVGASRDRMGRLRRSPTVVDQLMVPVFPTADGQAGADRFNVRSGALRGDGTSLVLEGDLVAHLRTGPGGSLREGVYDDHRSDGGEIVEGKHVVTDLRVDLEVEAVDEGAELQVWHDLGGAEEHRAVCVGKGRLMLRRGGQWEAKPGRELPWSGRFPLKLRMETVDGRFRVASLDRDLEVERLLFEAERDTSRYGQYSRLRLVLTGGDGARLSDFRVSRDTYWAWPDHLLATATGPYHVDRGYFVLGDNALVSGDSRETGPVSDRRLVGRVWGVIWPLSRVRSLP